MSEAAVRAYAVEKHFGSATLSRWLAYPPADRDALLELAVQLRLGENQLRDVLDDVGAIVARRGGGVTGLLSDEAVRGAVARSPGRNPAIRALKQALRRLRYPQLSNAEQRLAELGRALRLPAGVRVELPENLDGDAIALTLRGRTAGELRAQARAAAACLQGEALDEMFAVLEGLR